VITVATMDFLLVSLSPRAVALETGDWLAGWALVSFGGPRSAFVGHSGRVGRWAGRRPKKKKRLGCQRKKKRM
jgi:hypothetical protein